MLEVITLSVIILFICLTLLCLKIIIRKNGKFPHVHVGGNTELQKKGIRCAQAQDFEAGTQLSLFDRMSK